MKVALLFMMKFVLTIFSLFLYSASAFGVDYIWDDSSFKVVNKFIESSCVYDSVSTSDFPIKVFSPANGSQKSKDFDLPRGIFLLFPNSPLFSSSYKRTLFSGSLVQKKEGSEIYHLITEVSRGLSLDRLVTPMDGLNLLNKNLVPLNKGTLNFTTFHKVENKVVNSGFWRVRSNKEENLITATCLGGKEYLLFKSLDEKNELYVPFNVDKDLLSDAVFVMDEAEKEKKVLLKTETEEKTLDKKNVVKTYKNQTGVVKNENVLENVLENVEEVKEIEKNFGMLLGVEKYSDKIEEGEAEVVYPGVVSFFNPKINVKELRRKKELKENLKADLMNSGQLYICAKNYISAFRKSPKVSRSSNRISAGEPVSLINKDELMLKKKGVKRTYVKIMYKAKEYWVIKSSEYKKKKTNYLSTFSECSKIQKKVTDRKIKEIDSGQAESLTVQGISFVKDKTPAGSLYACVQDSLSLYKNKKFKTKINVESGEELQLIQGKDPVRARVNGKRQNFKQVFYEGKSYWASEKYLKTYSNCPIIHEEAVNVCSAGDKIDYWSENVKDDVKGQIKLGTRVFKQLGAEYSYQTAVVDKEEHKFVPIKIKQSDKEVYWVKEPSVNYEKCDALKGRIIIRTCRGFDPVRNKKGRIFKVKLRNFDYRTNTLDNFPLEDRPTSSYFHGMSKFYHSRKTRRHAGVDLYTKKTGSKLIKYNGRKRRRNLGADVYSINDGEIIDVSNFYCGTSQVTVRNADGSVWRYGEITNPVKKSGFVKRGEKIGTTIHVGACASKSPPMLHLEKYSGKRRTGGLTNLRNRIFQRRNDLENPSCHVQQMEKDKFGEYYENTYEK